MRTVRIQQQVAVTQRMGWVFWMTVSIPGQAAQRFEKLPCDPQCRTLEWLRFVSVATDLAVFYLHDLKLNAKR